MGLPAQDVSTPCCCRWATFAPTFRCPSQAQGLRHLADKPASRRREHGRPSPLGILHFHVHSSLPGTFGTCAYLNAPPFPLFHLLFACSLQRHLSASLAETSCVHACTIFVQHVLASLRSKTSMEGAVASIDVLRQAAALVQHVCDREARALLWMRGRGRGEGREVGMRKTGAAGRTASSTHHSSPSCD